MEKQVHNIQDVFLNNLRRDKLIVSVFLVSGVKLTGRIKSFDKYSVILESNQQEQLIFKHAISTVMPSKTSATGSHRTPAISESPSGKTKPPKPEPSN